MGQLVFSGRHDCLEELAEQLLRDPAKWALTLSLCGSGATGGEVLHHHRQNRRHCHRSDLGRNSSLFGGLLKQACTGKPLLYLVRCGSRGLARSERRGVVAHSILCEAADDTLNAARMLLKRLNEASGYLGLIAVLAELSGERADAIE
jgi:hypothetical protein